MKLLFSWDSIEVAQLITYIGIPVVLVVTAVASLVS